MKLKCSLIKRYTKFSDDDFNTILMLTEMFAAKCQIYRLAVNLSLISKKLFETINKNVEPLESLF